MGPENTEPVNYLICSAPVSIHFSCPHCDERVNIPFEREFWESGEVVECPECGGTVYLGNWEYD